MDSIALVAGDLAFAEITIGTNAVGQTTMGIAGSGSVLAVVLNVPAAELTGDGFAVKG